jgi:hypothetical protein
VAVPVWQAATTGSQGLPGHVNQFLGTHAAAWIYPGALQTSQVIGNATYQTTQGQYLAQSFTTGASQTAIGQVWLQVNAVGGSPVTATIAPFQLSLYATVAVGVVPTGSALATVFLNEQYVYSAPFWMPVPLGATGLTPSTVYQLVTSPVGTGTNYYAWQQSNQPSGASSSPDGVTWTSQAYGLMYQVYDDTGGGQLQFIGEDDGVRWTRLTYDAIGRVNTITEFTTAQAAGTFQSVRTLSYTNGALTGVS